MGVPDDDHILCRVEVFEGVAGFEAFGGEVFIRAVVAAEDDEGAVGGFGGTSGFAMARMNRWLRTGLSFAPVVRAVSQ